jgi:hypothetical protein
MAAVAPEAGLSYESLYRSLSAVGHPELETVVKVLGAIEVCCMGRPAGRAEVGSSWDSGPGSSRRAQFAVQGQCRASPPHPEAAFPGDELGGVRRCSARMGQSAEARTTRGGQPRHSALGITTTLTLRAMFRLALRPTEGLIGSIIALLGLDLAVPDRSSPAAGGQPFHNRLRNHCSGTHGTDNISI